MFTSIAAKLKINVETVRNSIKAATGKSPRKYPKKKRRNKGTGAEKRGTFREIADEVARRKDELGHSLHKIADDMGHCHLMIQRAYDHAHPEIIQAAIDSGDPPLRARNSRLGRSKKRRIEEMIRAGERTCDIVREVDCSRQTVARTRKRIVESGETP